MKWEILAFNQVYTCAACGQARVMVSVYIHFLMLKGSVLRYGISAILQFKELQLLELHYEIYIKLMLDPKQNGLKFTYFLNNSGTLFRLC